MYRGIYCDTGPCLTAAIWRCRKKSSQWQRSFQWKLCSHWLIFLWQRHVAVVRQTGPWLALVSNVDGNSLVLPTIQKETPHKLTSALHLIHQFNWYIRGFEYKIEVWTTSNTVRRMHFKKDSRVQDLSNSVKTSLTLSTLWHREARSLASYSLMNGH